MYSRLSEVKAKGRQLPAWCYTDVDHHANEIEEVFESGWMAVGYASDYSKINHAWSISVLGKPLLMTRDAESALHIFHNVCRHRGHVLLDKNDSAGKLLSCPYHAWCYALDGKFVRAPFWDGSESSAPTEHQKSAMGLVRVAHAEWYDIIFVNLLGKVEPFADFIAPLQARWKEDYPSTELHRFSAKNFSVNGNWKLAAENFLDNYHLPWIHPQLNSSMEAALGLDVENLRLSDNLIGFSHPTAGADKGKTSAPLPSWPGLSAVAAERQELFFVFPNVCLVMEGYYLWSMILFPASVDQCDEKLALYVVGDAAMDSKYDESRNQLSEAIYKINSQDEKVIGNLQLGRQGKAASMGCFNDFHDQLAKWFHQSVAHKLLNKINNKDNDGENV